MSHQLDDPWEMYKTREVETENLAKRPLIRVSSRSNESAKVEQSVHPIPQPHVELAASQPVAAPPAPQPVFMPLAPEPIVSPVETSNPVVSPESKHVPNHFKRMVKFLPKVRFRRYLRPKLVLPTAAMLVLVVGVAGIMNWGNEPVSSNVLSAQISQTVEEMAAINSDEQPVILTVTDKTKVQQEFLARAENGDQVLLYYYAKKAVLYRPSENKVISTGEFNPPAPKVFVRNGASKNRQNYVQKLVKANKEVSFVSSDASAQGSYDKTLVVVQKEYYKPIAESLAKTLGADIAQLPRGETSVEADILVIVGAK